MEPVVCSLLHMLYVMLMLHLYRQINADITECHKHFDSSISVPNTICSPKEYLNLKETI